MPELTSFLLLFQCLLAEMASCVHNLAQLSAQRVRLSVQSTMTTTGAPCLWYVLGQLPKAKTQWPSAPRMLAPTAAFTLLNLTAHPQIRLVPLELTLRDVTWASTATQWLRIALCHLCHPHHSKCYNQNFLAFDSLSIMGSECIEFYNFVIRVRLWVHLLVVPE